MIVQKCCLFGVRDMEYLLLVMSVKITNHLYGQLYINNQQKLLIGDFNAHTKLLDEFINVDRYNLDLNDDPESVASRAENESLLLEYF